MLEAKQKTGSRGTDAQTLKKLMNIIYEKERQIDKYKKQLRQKPAAKAPGQDRTDLGLSCEEKDYIAREIIQNKKFLQTASIKLQDMEGRIVQLETDLEAEENRNRLLENDAYEARCQLEDRDRVILELRTNLQLLENSKIHNNTELCEKERRIQVTEIENAKLKILSDQMKVQNLSLRERLREIELEVNKTFKYIQRALNSKKNVNKSQIDLLAGFSRIEPKSRQQIKTHTHLDDKLQRGLTHKVSETMEALKAWHHALARREEEWRNNFEKDICEQSFDGISQVINQSIMLNNYEVPEEKTQRSNFYETSMYKKNEEQLLKQLERECEKSGGPASVQKEKLVELSEVKQSLKMTKQVNEQLFDELNRQENIIRVFKETFRTLEQKKSFKNEESQEVRKLKLVLGHRN